MKTRNESTFTIIAPEPPEPTVELHLVLDLKSFQTLDNALLGKGQLGGAWYAIRDAKQELFDRGLI